MRTNLKFSNKSIYLLVKPYMLAFYVWVLILWFAPDYFKRYNIEILETKYLSVNQHDYYHDLNGDGISEQICVGYNLNGGTSNESDARVQHFDLERNYYDQWNVKGKWLLHFNHEFGDYNNNGFSEIYCLSIKDDSVFLSVNELMLDNGLIIENRFICKVGVYDNGKCDVAKRLGVFMDTDHDGYDEYLFILYGGFSKYPRNLFKYDIIKDSLIVSPQSASCPSDRFDFMDLNGDGIDEITGNSGTPENIHYPMPYTDSSAWLMVFDPAEMNFLFEPYRFNAGIGSYILPVFYSINDKKLIAMSYFPRAASNPFSCNPIMLFNADGKMIKKTEINKNEIPMISFFKQFNEMNNTFFLYDNFGNIYTADTSLEITVYRESVGDNNRGFGELTKLDLDGDGKDEIIFASSDQLNNYYLNIFSNGLDNKAQIVLPQAKTMFYFHLNLIENGTDKSPVLMVQTDNYINYLKYYKNPVYLLKYPVMLGAYLLLLLVFWLLQTIQNKYAKQKYEEEKQLARQQMALSKKQLEPHFMLNTLNNIGQMFISEKKEEAQFYFGKFASLIHRGLMYADQTETSLLDEIEFIRDYLVLQQRRYDNFDYIIEIDDDIDSERVLIPHSLLYTFVENAIKHGLRHNDGNKELKLKVIAIDEKINIEIIDNGIGINKSRNIKSSGTGKGLQIITSIVESYNKLNKRNIQFEVSSLENGTKVLITL